jgi:biopolymer transport protein ExbB
MNFLPLILAQATPVLDDAETVTLMPDGFLAFAWGTLVDGGWLMIPLGLLALFIYFEAMSLILRLGQAKVKQTPRATWLPWLDAPAKGKGHIGRVVSFVVGNGQYGEDTLLRLDAVRQRTIPDINNKITVLGILVTIAPLMGLLGTVIGMLATFRALGQSSAQAVDLVAEGIRIALITTQTGLMIAIPGYIFISQVIRKRNQYLAFLSELETVVVQRLYSK